MRKTATSLVCALILAGPMIGFAQNEIIVRVAPPNPIVEEQSAVPYEGAAWVPGYYTWDGSKYEWNHGRWDRPPRVGVEWEPGHWDHRGDGYVWIAGHWRQ